MMASCVAKEASESSAVDRDALVATIGSLEVWALVFTALVAIGVAGELGVSFCPDGRTRGCGRWTMPPR
jgi:hypothetical protein